MQWSGREQAAAWSVRQRRAAHCDVREHEMAGRLATVVILFALFIGPATAQFFPARTFTHRADLDDFIIAWYSKNLSAMNEPSLWNARETRSREAYRFVWLRTFHRPFAFRLELSPDGTGVLTAKSASGSGGYDPGQLVLNKTVQLKATEVRDFTSRLDKLGFWALPTQDPSASGLDGAQWIFEGIKDGRYHTVDRWTPKSGSFRELMLRLVTLAGENVEPVY